MIRIIFIAAVLLTGLGASAQNDTLTVRRIYEEAQNLDNCFYVVSKIHQERLSVYEDRDGDTLLLAVYPVCLSKNRGQKERSGDMKTPESYPGTPFHISQIQDASYWCHDFGNGRGSILSYGKWFMRLHIPGFKGIGIHGSTNNRETILQGRDSEGCTDSMTRISSTFTTTIVKSE